MAPRVSAIIPCYEMAGFVARAAESALAQTSADVEVIVCDDGSTDDPSAALAPLMAAHGERLRVVRQENRGLPAARNAAIAVSRGEYLAFLDADDWWYPQKTMLQLAVLDTDREAGFVWGQADAICEEDPSWRMVIGRAPGDPAPRRVIAPILRYGSMIPVLTGVVRRSAHDAIGGFDESLRRGGEDYDYWLRLAARFPGVFVPGPVARYRLHLEGFYVSNPIEWEQGLDRVHDKVEEAHRGDAEVMDALDLARHRVFLGRAQTRLNRGQMSEARKWFDRAAARVETREAAVRGRRRTFVPSPLYVNARRMKHWAESVMRRASVAS